MVQHDVLDFQRMAQIFREKTMKDLMLEIVILNILNANETMRAILRTDNFNKELKIPNKVFEWRMSHFKQRMDPNIHYIDVLRLEHPRTMGIWKMLIDLDNVDYILKLIRERNLESAFSTIKGCQNLLNIRGELKLNYTFNAKVLQQTQDSYKKYNETEMTELLVAEIHINETMDRCVDEELISDPIHQRYKRNVQLQHFRNLEFFLNLKETKIENSIEWYRNALFIDNLVFSKNMDFYNIQIESLKVKLMKWASKYEREYDRVDNDQNYIKINLKVMRQRHSDCLKRLEMYRADLEKYEEIQQRKTTNSHKLSKGKSLRKSSKFKVKVVGEGK